MKNLYDRVKDLLVKYPELRNSDKKLLWAVWSVSGITKTTKGGIKFITKESFYSAPSSESITRARRKVQENHPELESTAQVKSYKDKKQATKGMFAYHEKS